jgi:hypothetical protein
MKGSWRLEGTRSMCLKIEERPLPLPADDIESFEADTDEGILFSFLRLVRERNKRILKPMLLFPIQVNTAVLEE